jgi:hypothetical protein
VDRKDVPLQSQKRIAFMNHYRDLAGEYEWTAVDCDKKGAPDPVFVKPGWPNTRALGTLVAEACQWMLERNDNRVKIVNRSGLSDTDNITNVLRNLPTSKLVTEDLATAKRRTRQVRGAPPPLANFGAHSWPTTPCIAVTEVPLDRLVQELVWLGWRSVDAVTLRAEDKVGFLVALPLLYPCPGLPALPSSTKE